MKFKIFDETPDHSAPNLCFRCVNAQVIQGLTMSNMTVRCLAALSGEPLRITEPVVSCTEYRRRWDQTLQEMKDQAYILVTKKGRPVGFVSSKEARSKITAGDGDKADAQVAEVRDDDD